MKVTGLKIENYRKIAVLDIDISGDVKVKGKNGTGKSTVLDAIYYAITGGKLNMDKPIKEGENKAVIELTLEGENRKLEITRTITAKSNSLKVIDNGENKKRPADILATLLNKVSVDPQKFLEMSKKEQVELMAKVCEVKFDFDTEIIEHTKDVESRRTYKRDIDDLQNTIDRIVVPENIPENIPTIAEVNKELQEAMSFNYNIDNKKKNEQSLREEAERLKTRYEDIKAAIKEIMELPEKKSIEAINDKMTLANSAVNIHKKKEYQAKLEINKNLLKDIEKKIEDRSKRKATALKNANIPIEGLSTNGDTLLLNNIPFDQASSAERIKVSTTLAVMANKDLKLINIKDAVLLDKETMSEVVKVAKDNDCQLFMEMVSDDEDVVIEFVANESKESKSKTQEIKVEITSPEVIAEQEATDDHIEDNLEKVEPNTLDDLNDEYFSETEEIVEEEIIEISEEELTDKILSNATEEEAEEQIETGFITPEEDQDVSNLFDDLDELE